MKKEILKKMLSILIFFMILSQFLIPIILANQEETKNSINETETTLENLIEKDNNTNNILDNEFLNDITDENVNNIADDKEISENSQEKNNDINEKNAIEENSSTESLNARTASSVATTNSTTYFDSKYRLVF